MWDRSQASVKHSGLFGGTGELFAWDLKGSQKLPSFESVVACELAPGAGVGAHRHEGHEEVIVVVEGEGRVECDGVPAELRPGSLISPRIGSTMSLHNTSNAAPLRYLVVKAERRTAK